MPGVLHSFQMSKVGWSDRQHAVSTLYAVLQVPSHPSQTNSGCHGIVPCMELKLGERFCPRLVNVRPFTVQLQVQD